MKQILKTYSRKQYEDLQRELKDPSFEEHMLTIYTPEELVEIKEYKYVHPLIKLKQTIAHKLAYIPEIFDIILQYKIVFINVLVAVVLAILLNGAIKIAIHFKYDNSIRESDYYERLQETK